MVSGAASHGGTEHDSRHRRTSNALRAPGTMPPRETRTTVHRLPRRSWGMARQQSRNRAQHGSQSPACWPPSAHGRHLGQLSAEPVRTRPRLQTGGAARGGRAEPGSRPGPGVTSRTSGFWACGMGDMLGDTLGAHMGRRALQAEVTWAQKAGTQACGCVCVCSYEQPRASKRLHPGNPDSPELGLGHTRRCCAGRTDPKRNFRTRGGGGGTDVFKTVS